MSEDIKQDEKIDVDNLDVDWCKQSRLYGEWAERWAHAKTENKQAENQLEFTKADLDQKIRKDPAEYGLEKITEKALESTIVLQPDYMTAIKDVLETKEKVMLLEISVNRMETKKKAMEEILKVQTREYFSEPKAEGPSKEVMDRLEKRSIRRRGVKRKIK